MRRFRTATFPPQGAWDRRLTDVACPDLKPVELLHENPWFAVKNRGGYYTMEYHLPQVIALPVVERRAIVMVRAKRPVLDDFTLELPAGCSEEGEAPEQGMARELAEETGIEIAPSRLVPMPPLAASPNRMPGLVYTFQVDLRQEEWDGRGKHDDEIHSVELLEIERVVRMIASGEIYVAIPVAMIGTYLMTHKGETR